MRNSNKGGCMVENPDVNKKFTKEINSGVTSLVLLSVMEQAEEPLYGYQITKLLESFVDENSEFKQGTLYPVLRSLEKNGLLESNVEPSASGPPRRYYRITKFGQQTLANWRTIWGQTRSFVENVLDGDVHE